MENTQHPLTKWLDRNERSASWLARNLRVHPDTLARQLKKDTPMITRLAIQALTNGEIKLADWPDAGDDK